MSIYYTFMKARYTLKNEKLLLHLLREELKSRRLSKLLSRIGINDSPFMVTLNEPIAQLLGLKTDDDFRWYDFAMEHACRITDDQVSLTNEVETIARNFRID